MYDALTTRRVYKAAMPHDVARGIILQGTGNHFDPRVVEAFLAKELLFVALQQSMAEPWMEDKAAAAKVEDHSPNGGKMDILAKCET